jgi:hypothetical protein
MIQGPSSTPLIVRALGVLSALVVLKVDASIVWGYRDYFPPNFDSDFLLGREPYFRGLYGLAFYVHLVSGPPALAAGLLLVSERFRQFAPQWHRRIGRVVVAGVLLLVAPSGLAMAWHARTGFIAALGLAMLALVTAACAVLGWKAAVDRRFAVHRRWMWRLFLVLSSAVVIRVIGGLATVAGHEPDWLYPLAAWISWLGPLAVYEGLAAIRRVRPGVAVPLEPGLGSSP